jgi:site-specific DNA-methyltransferase (adenine-specific)
MQEGSDDAAGHRPALQWGLEPEAAYKEIVTSGPRKLADLMQALLAFLGRNDMMAYLVMMAIRLVALTSALRATSARKSHLRSWNTGLNS